MKQKLFKLIFSSYINRKVGKIWINQPKSKQHSGEGSFDPVDIQYILTQSWETYLSKASSLPQQPRVRLWLVMNFACLTLSAYQALFGFGIEKNYAIELIYELIWDVTSRSVRSANRLTTPIYQDTMRRLEVLVDLVMRVIFCEPAYQTSKGELENGFYMDVHTCPVADYLISNQAGDLCVNTWCAVDFGLVEIIGGRLERTGTQAMGEEKCDFSFFRSTKAPEYQI